VGCARHACAWSRKMPSAQVLIVMALALMAWYAGLGIVHGVKKVGHKIGCAVHHCEPAPPKQP
jgi:hypothetical protein